MKRIYACILIGAVILFLAFSGKAAVDGFQQQTETALDSIEKAVLAESCGLAAERTQTLWDDFREREHILSIFMRRDGLSALDVTLSALHQYAAEQNEEEALAEISRARSQIYAMCHLFFRML